MYFRCNFEILRKQCLLAEVKWKVKYDLKKYSVLLSLDSYWVYQQVTWCNRRSGDRKESLDLRDCADAPQIFITRIHGFGLAWILLLNEQRQTRFLSFFFSWVWISLWGSRFYKFSGPPFQFLTTLIVRDFFLLMCNWNFPYCNLHLLLLILLIFWFLNFDVVA